MWICEHCKTENEENVDYCWLCEMAGCLKDEHYCGDVEGEDLV